MQQLAKNTNRDPELDEGNSPTGTEPPLDATPELRHAIRCADTPEPDGIDLLELASARRALRLLKEKLGRLRLLELLHEEIAVGNTYLRTQLEHSAGRTTTGVTTLRAHGITAGQFTSWLSRAFGHEDVMLAGHPEHYAIHAADGAVNIVETLGELVCSFYMREWDDSATGSVVAAHDGGAARRSLLTLKDGTIIGSISNLFTDEPDGGFTAQLSVTLPVACGSRDVQQHLEHFAVEYRNWILAAAAEDQRAVPVPAR